MVLLTSGRLLRRRAIAAALLAAAISAPAAAHHSFAMFDQNRIVTLSGVVRALELINPHSWLQLTVTDARGRSVNWQLEMGDPAQLTRQGWTSDVVKPGERVTVQIHPRLDGSNAGQLAMMRLASGRQLEADRPASAPSPR